MGRAIVFGDKLAWRRDRPATAKCMTEEAVETTFIGKRNKRGDWRPDEVIAYGPVLVWPPQPMALLKWLFGYPGYFLPWGVIYMAIPVVTWLWFTPAMTEMTTFQPGWIAYIFVRNAILISLVVGAWHLRLYALKAQGTDWKYTDKWLARDKPQFMFSNQLLDNLFWTFVSGVPIWTAWEVVTMWLYANKLIPYVDWREHPIYCVVMMVIIPVLRDFHFYLIHRLIHWKPLYDRVHHIHHTNVDVGPITGLSMHPVEHLLYWSGVAIHWIVPSHPIHALFHLQHAALTPAQGHVGFERVVLHKGVAVKTHDFFHYLHHKYFECNYGNDGPLPLDKWFGTFNDGTDASTEAMNERFLAAARKKMNKT
jgi:sterol desaturase/sphingolipid hydroxylase (fatty acid hydroxylase superfamily)